MMALNHSALILLNLRLQLTVRETLDFSARCYGIGAKSGEILLFHYSQMHSDQNGERWQVYSTAWHKHQAIQ